MSNFQGTTLYCAESGEIVARSPESTTPRKRLPERCSFGAQRQYAAPIAIPRIAPASPNTRRASALPGVSLGAPPSRSSWTGEPRGGQSRRQIQRVSGRGGTQ